MKSAAVSVLAFTKYAPMFQHKHENTSLAAIRVFVMAYFRTAATEDGHVKAGHGYNGNSIGAAINSVPLSHNTMQSVSPPDKRYVMSGTKIGGGRF